MITFSFITGFLVAASLLTAPLPPREHPRLYLRSGDIPELRERMQTEEGKAILNRIKQAAIPRTASEEAAEKDRGFRYYAKMRGLTSQAQLDALDYLVTGNTGSARRAIDGMLDSLRHTRFGTKDDLSRASGQMLMVGAMVYDWCYDRLGTEEKQDFIKEFVRIAGTMECRYPPKRTEPIAGHSSEWMILRDMLSAGIAIYDEYPDMYNYAISMLCEDYVPVRNYIYAGHNYHQGSSYINVRFTSDLISNWIITRMGAGPLYSPEQQYVLYDIIYRRRPDGLVLPAGDENPARRGSFRGYAEPMMLAASYYRDPYLMYEFEKKPSVEPHLLMMQLLWQDFNLKGKSPDDLPLTRYSGSPFGWMTARTGWGGSSVIVEMKTNEQFVGNHQHLDGGAFQIYYKGPLAIDSGAYQGSSGGYNSPHNKNYFKRTIAHNSLLVYDPEEKFECFNYGGENKTATAANDGGQRMPGEGWDTCRSFKDLLSDNYTVGKAVAHAFGPDSEKPQFSYLKGDITKAYTEKVSDVQRSFVFLNLENAAIPAALIIFDHVSSTNPAFKKTWLLHSIEEPVTDLESFTVSRTLDGDSGMLRCDVLEPANPIVDKVGGRGREFTVNGINYENFATTRPDPANERGSWRVEVSPSVEQTEDCFLNVIQIADNSCNSFYKPIKISTDVLKGVVLNNRVVTFSANSKLLDASFELEIPSEAGKSKVLLTDLAPGKWKVLKNGKKLTAEVDVTEEEACASFSAPVGRYVIEKQ